MQKNSNRKGLALGAAFAMVASLFVGVAPASANTDGQYVALTPEAGPVTNFNGILAEDFPVTAYLLPGITNGQFAGDNNVIYEITKVSGAMEVLVNNSNTASGAITSANLPASAANADPVPAVASVSAYIQASSSTAITVSASISATGVAKLNLRAYTASGIVSSSPSVTLNIKVWVENAQTKNGVHDALEWFTTKTVVLHSINAVPATATVGSPKVGDKVLTVSGTVTTLNFDNLDDSNFFLVVESTNNQLLSTGASTVSSALTGATMALRAGVVSQSFVVSGSGLVAGTSVSAHVRYSSDSGVAVASGFRLGALAPAVIAGTKTAELTLDVVEGDNASQSGTTATVRANQTYTFRVGASSDSASVSGAALEATLTAGTGTLAVNVKEISVDGAAATTSYPSKLALTTGTDGFASFTIKTTGFADGDGFSIKVVDGNVSKSLTVVVKGATNTLSADDSLLSTAVGAATPVLFSVEDQWGVASADTDLRLMVTKGGPAGFAYTDTVSYVAVAAGAAKFDFTPTPATKTGSATVKAQLQQFNKSTGAYGNVGSEVTVTVNVTAIVDAHSVGPVVSQSASVSYFPSTVSWTTITGSVVNEGALIEVTGPAGLVFRQSDVKDDTSSAKLTLRAAAAGAYSFQVASLLIKSHIVTIKTGTASTTSLLVVDAVTGSMGVKVAFDKSTITAGETSVITGTVTDANGNPVDTTNSGSTAVVVVSWTGKGLPFNTGSNIETDEDGKFKVNVLALAGDLGTGTITATYRPAGAAVDTKNVTATQVITIAAPAAVAGPEINAVIGSFNGRWAVRVENAKGAVVSVKVGNRWVKFTALNDNYLFSRKSRVGATLPVAVYVNGQLENVATITIK
jgi:hypothetical protein